MVFIHIARERQRHTQLNAEFQRIVSRDKNGFLNEQCKEVEDISHEVMGPDAMIFIF